MRRPRVIDNTPARPALGAVRADEGLPLAELARRFGWGREAQAEATKRGLRTIRYGKRKYVLGRDVLAWLDSLDGGGEEAITEGGAQ